MKLVKGNVVAALATALVSMIMKPLRSSSSKKHESNASQFQNTGKCRYVVYVGREFL